MTRHRAIWAAWWFGTVLIVLSWIRLVPVALGWAGFVIACAASVTSVVVHRYWRPPEPPGGPLAPGPDGAGQDAPQQFPSEDE